MTPFAKKIMKIVRQTDHKTHEQWFQAIVDATLEAAGLNAHAFNMTDEQIVALLKKPTRKRKPKSEPCE